MPERVELLKNTLCEMEIDVDSYQTEQGSHVLRFTASGEKFRDCITTFVLEEKNPRCRLYCFTSEKVSQSKIFGMYDLLNTFNREYGWVCFYISDEDEIVIRSEFISEADNVVLIGRLYLAMLCKILDTVYPQIMKCLWS